MKLNIKETVIFAMLGSLMYATKLLMQILPNIHLIGVFIIATTVVYRKKALYPLYTYVLIEGLISGFSIWWIPYLYLWTLLWGATMLLPKKMPNKIKPIVYMVLCSLHGFLFGILYAPAQAILFGLDWNGMIAWIISGLTFDIIHGVSSFFCGALICPIIKLLKSAERVTKNN